MKACVYRESVDNGFIACHCEKLLCPETIPDTVCNVCPYATAPSTDYLTANAQLGRKLIKTGAIKPVKPRPCGNCPGDHTEKRLPQAAVPDHRTTPDQQPDELQFVWTYWHAGAQFDELRWSIRAIESNYQGKARITVIGDKPPWYEGHWIRQPRLQIKDKGFQRGLRDVLAKMDTLSRHPDIDDEFIWMMDDVFLTQPTNYADLKTPRAAGTIRENKGNRWQSIKSSTAARLIRNGHTAYDYGTHLPHHVDKSKLREMFERWNPREHLFLWEVVYGNLYRDRPQNCIPYLARLRRGHDAATYDRIAATAHWINIAAKGGGHHIRNWLVSRYPQPASCETGAAPTSHARRVSSEPIERHVLLIQSAYSDERLSRQRLDLSRLTIIPSLAQQTADAEIVVSVHPDDPHLADRQETYRSTGRMVRFVEASSDAPSNAPGVPKPHAVPHHLNVDWQLQHGVRQLVGRCDDDDILPTDFCEISQRAARTCPNKSVLIWPNGYVFFDGEFYRLHHEENQFCAIVSDDGTHPHEHSHRSYVHAMPVTIAEPSRGWVWVRHRQAISRTLNRYLRHRGTQLNIRRFPYDFDAITSETTAELQYAQ